MTEFLPSHPGGSSIILKLAGRDATEEYDPIHPPGTLEDNLNPKAKLGKVDPTTLPKPKADEAEKGLEDKGPPSMQSLLNLDEIEEVATKQISKKCWAYYYCTQFLREFYFIFRTPAGYLIVLRGFETFSSPFLFRQY